jgi:hypothetical protein
LPAPQRSMLWRPQNKGGDHAKSKLCQREHNHGSSPPDCVQSRMVPPPLLYHAMITCDDVSAPHCRFGLEPGSQPCRPLKRPCGPFSPLYLDGRRVSRDERVLPKPA